MIDTDDRRRGARMIHTSDCHLDRVDGGPEQRAFEAVVDLCISREANALLIAGDLFDHNRVALEIVEWVADELNRFNGAVVLLVGNHDCMSHDSVHNRHDLREACPRLQRLDDPAGAWVDVPGTDISVWGRAMIEHTPAFRPVGGAPAARADRWSVVAAHGLVDADMDRSSPIAPAELAVLEADYVALGHIHAHAVIRTEPLTMYSGASYRPGVGKSGCVAVEFSPATPAHAVWIATASHPTGRRESIGRMRQSKATPSCPADFDDVVSSERPGCHT